MESQSPVILKMSDSAFSSSTSHPRSSESFSIFGDGSCGEPLMTQHLVLDFTPLEEVDNDFVQRKCCAFWEFVSSQPGLQKLMVMPDPNVYRKNFETSDSLSDVELLEFEDPIVQERTAVSMLEIVEAKGLINRTFEAKLAQSQCSLGSREYRGNDELTLPLARSSSLREACSCSGSCSTCTRRATEASRAASSPRAVDLCRKMQKWDADHPKCMDPPAHPPALSHCVMQRKAIT